MSRTLVFTATYNEVDNVGPLLREIRAELPAADVLVVDDASPDGTGALLDALAKDDPALRVIHRPAKLGLGSAHKLAMAYAIREGYDFLVTMDADFSHHPRHLRTLVALLGSHVFVTGSRYVAGGRCGYGPARTLLSRTANLLARALLGIPLHECTTSFRGFSVPALARLDLDLIRSDGYAFFVESLFHVARLGGTMAEFPIDFEDRRAGTSKISRREIHRALTKLLGLALGRVRRRVAPAAGPRGDAAAGEIACPHCAGPWASERHPATRERRADLEAYRCTSGGHRSHGRIVQCLACGLVYDATPLPPETLHETYASVEDPTYVANLEARYATFGFNLERIRPFLPPGGRILDVGAYCGAFVKVAREAGYDAAGVEPSAWAARYATEVLGERVFCGTLEELPADEGPFDAITMWDVLEHLTDVPHELAAVRARLKPGGILALSTLNVEGWYPRLAGERWPWIMDMHLAYYSPATLARVLARAGFRVVHARSYRHYVTAAYAFEKAAALGIPGARAIRRLVARTPAGRLQIPFQLGDVQLVVCRLEEAREPGGVC